jgi:hypothetical protein
MIEYVNVRASEILDQDELVSFLKARFPDSTKTIGKMRLKGYETVEIRVLAHSREFEEIRDFIAARRLQGQREYTDFTIGWVLRSYTKSDLQNAEALMIKIAPHFEPSGEECGTVYETLCNHCNWGRQISDLSLDLRRVPQHKDISQTIARVEWIVSSKFIRAITENKLTGADFHPIFDLRNPLTPSTEWHQLRVTGTAGGLAEETTLGRDPFSTSQLSWQCPLGHSSVAEFLSEVRLHRTNWDGSDIAITNELFGQGLNLVRPTPLIVISQRTYRVFERAELKGLSYECAHLV